MTAAFDGSVTWAAPPDSVQASQVSTVPKHRSPPTRAVGVGQVEQEGQLGGRRVGGQAQPLRPGASRHMPDGAEVLPADAGPDRLAGGAGPTGSSTPAGW